MITVPWKHDLVDGQMILLAMDVEAEQMAVATTVATKS
jgi:hypothetical protein